MIGGPLTASDPRSWEVPLDDATDQRIADDDKPHDECGVFGIFAPGEDVARLTFFALYALQHRGQESAGIATSDGSRLAIRTRLGLVAQAFTEDDLSDLRGHVAIGHTRYSTSGSNRPSNAGPVMVQSGIGQIAVAHNGNLTNAFALREELEATGEHFQTSTDSEVLTRLIAAAPGLDLVEKVRRAMPRMIGAFSLTVLSRDTLLAVRDPRGVRPLCLGRLGGHLVVASESCALATIGAFRVVAESDLHDLRDDSQGSRRSLKHLENEGLIRTSPLSSEDRAVTLTDRGRDLLEVNRSERDDRTTSRARPSTRASGSPAS